MEKVIRAIRQRKPLPFGVEQVMYGVSILATFTVVSQIVMHM